MDASPHKTDSKIFPFPYIGQLPSIQDLQFDLDRVISAINPILIKKESLLLADPSPFNAFPLEPLRPVPAFKEVHLEDIEASNARKAEPPSVNAQNEKQYADSYRSMYSNVAQRVHEATGIAYDMYSHSEHAYASQLIEAHRLQQEATRAANQSLAIIRFNKAKSSTRLLDELEQKSPVIDTANAFPRQSNRAVAILNTIHHHRQRGKAKREVYTVIAEYVRLLRSKARGLLNAIEHVNRHIRDGQYVSAGAREGLGRRLQFLTKRVQLAIDPQLRELEDQMPDGYDPTGKDRCDFWEVGAIYTKANLLKDEFELRCDEARRIELKAIPGEKVVTRITLPQTPPSTPTMPVGLAKWNDLKLAELRSTLPAAVPVVIDPFGKHAPSLEQQLLKDQCKVCRRRFNDPTLILPCEYVACFRCAVIFVDEQHQCPTCRRKAGLDNFLLLEVTRLENTIGEGRGRRRRNQREGSVNTKPRRRDSRREMQESSTLD